MLCALGAAPGWLLLGPSLCTQIPGSRAVQELGAVRGAEHISLRASRPARSSPSLQVLQLTDSCVCCPASLQSSRCSLCPRCAVRWMGLWRSSGCGCSPSWQRVVLSDFCL